MLYILLTGFIFSVFFYLTRKTTILEANDPFPDNLKNYTWVSPFLCSVALRVILSLLTAGYASDMNCWLRWSEQAYANGLSGFYSGDFFCDYPPGYIYILYLLGAIRNWFPGMPPGVIFAIYKLPAILFDGFLCIFLFRQAYKCTDNKKFAFALSFLYALTPSTFINSAVWGQVDGIFTFFVLYSIMLLARAEYMKSSIFYAIAVILKPQALLFAPIFLITIVQNYKIKNFWKLLFGSVLGFIGTCLILVLPFTLPNSPLTILSLYQRTLSSYPYASLNAFNVYTLLGANGLPLENQFLGISYRALGFIGLILAVLVASYLFYKGKDKSKFFYTSALLLTGIFLLGTKMHERYLFPAIAFLFMAYVYKRETRILLSAFILSLLHFWNVGYIYVLNTRSINYAMPPDAFASLCSLLHLAVFAYMLYLGFSLYSGFPKPCFPKEKRSSRFERKDWISVVCITAIYTWVAFSGLGNSAVPQTPADTENIGDFGSLVSIASASVYKGIGDCEIDFSFSYDGENWSEPVSFSGSPCFKWETYKIKVKASYVRVSFRGDASAVYEAAFFDEAGRQLPIQSRSRLFDEQHLAEPGIDYKNSTYFDEIYHARTAFEHINHVPSHYENTHPPLGKYLIGVGIRLFGMHPFGWRFMGTLFGCLLLPLMYVFGKKLFKSTTAASFSMLFMAFDLMHFAQSRIATIDIFAVFFIVLMYFFMYLFYENAEHLPLRKVCLYLLSSGIAFGLAIATKWIGFYAGAGLAALFFIGLWKRVRKKGTRALWICGLCCIFFLCIPFLIYYASYIPIHIDDGAENHFANFWNYQKHMFSYHSKLSADHPYGSKWYTWPMVYRPIWYYGNKTLAENGITSSIFGMGNPLIWWGGFLAMLLCMIKAVRLFLQKKADDGTWFIAIGFLSQLVPWMFVSRVVFIYHYFASLPFSIFALCYIGQRLREKFIWGNRFLWIFMFLCGLVFFAFLPVVSGIPVPKTYVLSCLKWFQSWVLTY